MQKDSNKIDGLLADISMREAQHEKGKLSALTMI